MVIRMLTLSQATLSQALTVLDAARKRDEWIAAHQQQGYSDKDRIALFAASQEAYALQRKTDWRLPATADV